MLNFTRQNRIFNPSDSTIKIIIVGVGSTGSFLAFTLAKMGIENIKVIDYDKVEEHNIPNQYFRLKDVGKYKVDALKEIIKDFSGVEIETENKKVNKKYDFDLDMDTIVISCVDTIPARRLFAELLGGFPIKLIDTRFGGEGYSIHVYNLGEDEDVKSYLDSLKGKIKPTSCGEKSIIYAINSLASEVCNIVKKINNNEDFPKLLRRQLTGYKFIKSD